MVQHGTVGRTLRRAVGTRARRALLVVTIGVGAVAAALTAGLPSDERTVATVAELVHGVISVLLPFVGVLLAHGLRQAPGARVLPTLAAAASIAVAVGLAGDALSFAALAVAGSTAPDPWAHVGAIVVAGVLVQVLAQLVGTGLGLLIGRPVWACLATIVLPLGAYALLTPVAAARDWLTPYAALRAVLAESPGDAGWARWATVALLWGVALNGVGAVLRRHRASHGRATTVA
ncbi:hypothetical protein ACH495_11240 [Micromonospora sp. NPDC018662]|uniref:hypothetical protein n=1 Tax=Micromonospora sp. NPDC018662 TaxID=3364238 RepID=UPI003799DAD1